MKHFVRNWPYWFIIVVWFVFSYPYFLKGFVPFPSTYLTSFFPPWNAYYGMPVKNNAMPDIITQIFPWKKLTIDSWKMWQVPLWNPYSFSGTAHGGNYQSSIFSPLNLLFLFLPFIHAWSLSVLLQPLTCGIFMLLFLKSLKRSNSAAVLGSVSFMFCGFMTTWMGYATLGWAISFLPFILFSINKFLELNSWWYGMAISIGIACSLLSGHYQISFYVLIACLIFIAGLSIPRKKRLSILAFVGLGILLCFDQILLSLHTLLQSNRSMSFTSGSIPWHYLITIFSPDFFGNPVTRNDWFGQYAEWSSYIGIIPLFLSIFSILGGKVKGKGIFIALLVLSSLFAIASPFNTLLYSLKIPVISTSVATRMIVLVSFSLTILSAFGFDELVNEWKENKLRKIRNFSFFIALLLGIFWIYLLISKLFPQEYLSIAIRNSILPTGNLIILLLCMFIGLKLKRTRFILLSVFIVITAFDMLRFSRKWMPFDPSSLVYPEMPVITTLQNTVENNRVFGTFGNELNTYYAIPAIEGYDAMYQQRYGEFISAAGDGKIKELQRSVVQIDKQGLYTNKWMDLLGVKYILYRKSDGRNVWVFPHWTYPQYVSIYQDEKYEILENKNTFARAFTVSSYEVISDKQKIIDALTTDSINLKSKIVLEEKIKEEPTAGEAKTTILRYTPNVVEILVETHGPKILFVSDPYDSGWQATVNGKKEKIYRANYAFRAVLVPDGKSTVKFYYQPFAFNVGLFVSGLSMLVLITGSMRKLMYDRRYL